jgi:O-antigen/teichoic acid export membrane protein
VCGRPELRARALAVGGAARLVAVTIAVTLGGATAILLAFASGTAAGMLFSAWMGWRVAWRRWPRARARFDLRAWTRRLFGFAIHSSLATTVTGAAGYVVPVLLGHMAGSRAVGLFGVALFPVTFAGLASSGLRLALFPEQAKLAAAGRLSVLLQSVRTYTRWALGIGVIGALAGAAVLPWLIPALYTSSFSDAIDPARILLVGAAAQMGYGWAKSLPAAIGRPAARTVLATIELVLTVTLVLLLREHGVTGAAVAVSTTSIALLSIWSLAAERLIYSPAVPTTTSAAGAMGRSW